MEYSIEEWTFEEERLTVWTSDDLDVDPDYIGYPGSPTVVSSLTEAAGREHKRQFLTGSPEELARQMAGHLRKIL